MTDASSGARPAGTIRVRVFGRTDVGRVREHNEDSFLVADLTRGTRTLRGEDREQTVGPHGTLMAVCDGMGGAAAGEVASELAVRMLFERLSDGPPPTDHDDLARRLVRAVEAAGLRIYGEAKLDRHHRGMGTTTTAAALIDPWLFVAQVGDSRAYLLRRNHLVQITRDQSLVNQLIEAGQLTEEEAENFEHNNIILQALGTSDTVQVDLTFVELRKGDRLLVCSDGLSGLVRLDDLRHALQHYDDPVEACRALTEKANDGGGHDNITCIVAQFDGPGLEEPSDDTPPRYEKYVLSEDLPGERTSSGRRSSVKELSERKIGADVKHRLSDHGPSPSKLANTLLGMQAPIAPGAPPSSVADSSKPPGRPDSNEVIVAVDGPPLWVLGAIVVVVFGGLVLAAYFYIIR